jgi:hypothetical protein
MPSLHLIQVGKFTKVVFGPVVVSTCCFLDSSKALSFVSQLRSPFTSLFAECHTLIPMHSWPRVAKILRMVARAQILNSVVVPDSVNVVQLFSEIPVVVHPYKVMNSVYLSVHHSHHVPLGLLCADDRSSVATFDRHTPKKMTRVVNEQFVKPLLCDHGFG